nr:unnamed protein product [Callosobruchus analis]
MRLAITLRFLATGDSYKSLILVPSIKFDHSSHSTRSVRSHFLNIETLYKVMNHVLFYSSYNLSVAHPTILHNFDNLR